MSTITITRNGQAITFSTNHADADLVQMGAYRNQAGIPHERKNYLIDGLHVIAGDNGLARQIVREYLTEQEAAKAPAKDQVKALSALLTEGTPQRARLDTSRAAQRAQDAVSLMQAIIPSDVVVERIGREVYTSQEGANHGFTLIFGLDGITMSKPGALLLVEVDGMDALNVIRKHYAKTDEVKGATTAREEWTFEWDGSVPVVPQTWATREEVQAYMDQARSMFIGRTAPDLYGEIVSRTVATTTTAWK